MVGHSHYKYQAWVYGAFTRELNYAGEEVERNEWALELFNPLFLFNTLEELQRALVGEFADCAEGYAPFNGSIAPYGEKIGGTVVENALTWKTLDRQAQEAFPDGGLSPEDEKDFKEGVMDIYEHVVAFNIYPYPTETVKLEEVPKG